MKGKILKILNNDLYGNADDRQIAIFAAFNHVKYMNKYVIFAFDGEFDKKKLCYGSIHFKKDSVVIFSVAESVKEYIDDFVSEYVAGKVDPKKFEILDLSDYNKAEMVTYCEEEYEDLTKLDELSIKREKREEEVVTNKKPAILYVLLVIMILLLAGVTYLYFFPEKFTVELKKIECTATLYNSKLDMYYTSDRTITFDKDDKLRDIDVIDTYKFTDINQYDEFKMNNKESIYFKDLDGAYKYEDSLHELKLIYNETSIIEDYDDMFAYLKSEGHSCTEGTYYE